MNKMGSKRYLAIVIAIMFMLINASYVKGQEAHKYKCVEITNHGDPWPNEDIKYYIEFNDDNTLTRWQLQDGEWKFGKVFELHKEYSNGVKVYVYYEKIMVRSDKVCTDMFQVSADRTSIVRSYRCPNSEYAFNYEFVEY